MVRALALLLLISLAGGARAVDLVIIGDSVSATSDAGAWSAGQGFGAIVAARLGMTEVNLAASGATVVPVGGEAPVMQSQWDAALARIPRPARIIFQPGENDVYWQTDLTTFTATLDAQVASAVALGIPVTLNTSFHRQSDIWYRQAPAYVQAVKDIAAKYGCQLVDVFGFFSSLSLTDPNFQSYFYTGDGINAHPNVYGQLLIASLFHDPPIPQIPAMTAATTSGVTITGNDLNSTGTTTSAPVWDIAAGPAYTIQWNQSGGGWVEIQFPSAFVPFSYSLRADPRTSAGAQAYAPKTRTFQGWNGTTWDDLDQVTNEPAWLQGERRARLVSTQTAYSRYRLNVTASQGGTYLQFRELQISK